MRDKKHWYDGRFYDKLIAPNQDRLFGIIDSMIEKESRVVDIGCGTGRFCFSISYKCNEVIGLDLSSKNINVAKSNLLKSGLKNISFIHGDAKNINEKINKKFDYAVLTYMIHELDLSERNNVLKQAKQSAEYLIIGDYISPQPKNHIGLLNKIVEFVAGREHYSNFKSFQKNGGLKNLAEINNLKIVKEVTNNPEGSHIVLLK